MFRDSVSRNRGGFTLVELLVVIAIIGILVGLLLPAVQAAREAARRMQCSNNLKQLGLAVMNYESAIKRLPPGGLHLRDGFGGASNSTSWGPNWLVMLLPYMEQGPLYAQYNTRSLFARESPLVVGTKVPTFACPSDTQDEAFEGAGSFNGVATKFARGNYACNGGGGSAASRFDSRDRANAIGTRCLSNRRTLKDLSGVA